MRILLATDAWSPQINGVVRTYQRLQAELKRMGVELAVLGPDNFRCVPCPSYPDIGLALPNLKRCTDLIEAARPVLVNGKPQTRAPLLAGDRVTLGSSCQFLFQKPVPVSASARLEMVSGHRLPLSVSAVLLMADSLVLGPGSQVHVPIGDRKESIVLFRQDQGLGIRCPGDFVIDGKRCKDKGSLGLQAAAQGPDFALAIEPAGRI